MSSSRAFASRLPLLIALGTLACTDQQNLGKDREPGDAGAHEQDEHPSTDADASVSEGPDSDGSIPSEHDVDGQVVEPGPDAGNDEDASVPEGACDPRAPFITSTWYRLPQNGEIDDAADAWLSPNQLKLFFSRRGSSALGQGGGELYEQQRADKEGAFAGTKLLFQPVAGDQNDTRTSTYGFRPTLSGNLLSLFYINDYGWLMNAKRKSTDDMFPTPVAVVYDKDSRADSTPAFAVNDQELWFAAQHGDVGFGIPGFPGSGTEESNLDLMRVSVTDPAAKATPISELNTALDEDSPVLSSDGLWIYWRAVRMAAAGGSESALFVAHRDSTDQPFSHIEEQLDLGSATPLYLSPDYCSLYYVGDGGGVYEAKRQQ